MKVYLATSWVDRDQMPAIADAFTAAGHTITERWWLHPDVPGYPDIESEDLENQAIRDFDGVVNADVFVLMNRGKSEGKAVETGIALTMCHRIIVVGKRSNIFHYMPEVEFAETSDDVLDLLRPRD